MPPLFGVQRRVGKCRGLLSPKQRANRREGRGGKTSNSTRKTVARQWIRCEATETFPPPDERGPDIIYTCKRSKDPLTYQEPPSTWSKDNIEQGAVGGQTQNLPTQTQSHTPRRRFIRHSARANLPGIRPAEARSIRSCSRWRRPLLVSTLLRPLYFFSPFSRQHGLNPPPPPPPPPPFPRGKQQGGRARSGGSHHACRGRGPVRRGGRTEQLCRAGPTSEVRGASIPGCSWSRLGP